MPFAPIRRPMVRLSLYVLVFAAVLIFKGVQHRSKSEVLFPLMGSTDTTTTITVSGVDLAPELIERLVASYKIQYPDQAIVLQEGGTAFGLEAVANRKATVAMLYRPPTEAEQALVRSAAGDTVVWFPIAVGGVILLRQGESATDSLTQADLRALLTDQPFLPIDRLYAPDPNQGLWNAFCRAVGAPEIAAGAPPKSVSFLKNASEVRLSVASDPKSLGLASSLDPADDGGGMPIHSVPVRADTAATATDPSFDAIAAGRYPLYHYLYAACLPYRNTAAAMFVTYLTSDQGQRAVERAGYIPSWLPAREIHLTVRPLVED